MKQTMRQALDHRLPVTGMNVLATMLDPSQRALGSVQDYLTEHKMTAVDMLKQAVQKYVGDEQLTPLVHTSPEEFEDIAANPWKKAKHDLLQKHATTVSSLDCEIQQYKCLAISSTDVI
jgi:hypothetical protein